MAKTQAEKDAEALAKKNAGNTPAEKLEKDEADAAIFGGDNTPAPTSETIVAPSTPNSTPSSTPAPTQATNTPEKTATPRANSERTVTLKESQFHDIMERLNDLESKDLSTARTKEDVFNPLAEVKSNHVVRVVYWEDELVVGYKGKKRIDGRTIYTYLRLDPQSNLQRTYVVLQLRHPETKEIREVEVDYIAFLEGAVPLDATITKRHDVGKLIEQGLVTQNVWDGKNLQPTGRQVMSGAKEQEFVFDLKHLGEDITLPERVVNIK